MDVAGHHHPRHIALEARDAMISTDVESMHLQRIDRRFHRRMGASRLDEIGVLLDLLRLF